MFALEKPVIISTCRWTVSCCILI